MDDLIEALTILRKYGNPPYPTHCEHDEMAICGISPKDVSDEDKKRLGTLGFFVSCDCENGDEEHECDDEDAYFMSFKFGSA